MTATRPEQPTPDYVPGHGLLRDKVVVVTAAAGAGIGAAVVRRVLEEGARGVVLGDTHERRLAEADAGLREEFGDDRVRSLLCDVTDEAQVQALIDAADEFGGVDVMVNNAGVLSANGRVHNQSPEEWRRADGSPTDVMHQIEVVNLVQTTRLFERRALPPEIMKP